MGRVVYSTIMSLDGFIADAEGSIEPLVPPSDVHEAANEQARRAAAFLFGRRLFEMMETPWQELAQRDDLPAVQAEFAEAYLATPRIVFSDTLQDVPDGVRLVRSADAVAEVTKLAQELDGDLCLGGAALAASLFDLVDELSLFVLPLLLGGGKPFLPVSAGRMPLRLAGQHRFDSGAVELRYERIR